MLSCSTAQGYPIASAGASSRTARLSLPTMCSSSSRLAMTAACDPVTAPHQRITLTLAAVMASQELLLHIVGSDKRSVLEEAPAQGYPVASAVEQDNTPVSIWWAP